MGETSKSWNIGLATWFYSYSWQCLPLLNKMLTEAAKRNPCLCVRASQCSASQSRPLVTKGWKDATHSESRSQNSWLRLPVNALFCPQVPVSKHKYYNIECTFKLDIDPRIPTPLTRIENPWQRHSQNRQLLQKISLQNSNKIIAQSITFLTDAISLLSTMESCLRLQNHEHSEVFLKINSSKLFNSMKNCFP